MPDEFDPPGKRAFGDELAKVVGTPGHQGVRVDPPRSEDRVGMEVEDLTGRVVHRHGSQVLRFVVHHSDDPEHAVSELSERRHLARGDVGSRIRGEEQVLVESHPVGGPDRVQ